MLLVNCLAACLRVDTIRDAANHVPWLKVRALDLCASGRVKAALNLLDERLLEWPEACGIACRQLADRGNVYKRQASIVPEQVHTLLRWWCRRFLMRALKKPRAYGGVWALSAL